LASPQSSLACSSPVGRKRGSLFDADREHGIKLRKHMTGESAGWVLKTIGIALLVIFGVLYLKQCAQDAQRVAAHAASQAVDAAGNAISDMASSAVDAAEDKVKDAVCGLPLVGKACAPATDTTAPDPTTAPAANIPKQPQSTCLTLEQAAKVQLANARACTRIAQVEFGGNLYAQQRAGQTCYLGAPPYRGATRSVDIPPVEQPGWTRVGTYHSHPRGGAGAYFSVNDLCTSISKKETGFLVATDDYSFFATPLPILGTDGEVRRFVPTKGLTFAQAEVNACLTKTADDWILNDWTCPRLESKLDADPSEVGTITKLDDLPRVANAPCNYQDTPKMAMPSYPSCMH
jgi:hypothetical protein